MGMEGNIRCTNLRFNIDKEPYRSAWECLQDMDRTKYHSYSHAVAEALVEHFDREKCLQSDPYLETREKEDLFVSRIIAAIGNALKEELPTFLAGCFAGVNLFPAVAKERIDHTDVNNTNEYDQNSNSDQSTGELDADVDFDFLGQ